MLIGIGHDIQVVSELAGRDDLWAPGVLFTEGEVAYAQASRSPLSTLAGMFSAKEAVFKAVPDAAGGFWTDIEVAHDARRAPSLCLRGALGELFEARGWAAWLSISHGGDYASAVVVIAPAASLAARAPEAPGAGSGALP